MQIRLKFDNDRLLLWSRRRICPAAEAVQKINARILWRAFVAPAVGRAAFKIYLRRNSRRILAYLSAVNFMDLRLQAGFVLMPVRFFGRASGL